MALRPMSIGLNAHDEDLFDNGSRVTNECMCAIRWSVYKRALFNLIGLCLSRHIPSS